MIVTVDPGNDSVEVDNHGLQTGDSVEYDAQGHTPIGGLLETFFDTLLGETLSREYNVIALDYFQRKGSEADATLLEPLTKNVTPVKGKRWDKGDTVGKVAERAIAGKARFSGETGRVVHRATVDFCDNPSVSDAVIDAGGGLQRFSLA